AEVEQNTIVSAESRGLLFRGFEKMLRGRSPLDAIFFTERICGICSAAHAYASTLALEDALHISPTKNDKYLREIIHGFEYIQNHLRHFYIMVMPGFVKITALPIANVEQYSDFRLPDEINRELEEHYAMSFEFARMAHEGQAVLAGKAPHNHGIFVGGVTTDITAYKLEKVKSIINRLRDFVTTAMREDAETLANYYSDYYKMGISYPYFMSYGAFNNEDEEISYVKPGVLADGILYALQPDIINEQVQYSWYQNDMTQDINLTKSDAYTFIKAPRYNNMPMEVGPLARMLVSGNYFGGHSCMDRIMARMLETEKILSIMEKLSDRIEIIPNGQQAYEMPNLSQGVGLIDTTRGALGHWVSIKNNVIEHYNIITPSNWNLSPKDSNGVVGVIEKALLGTVLNDVQSPVEIGRIVRSFDPCVSCATHLITRNGELKTVEVLV
ncbi:MAG: nickel-dependent hydrogenase large subunit, partial [Herbinix sp.]|nr:nickel-dependent hydrogenase large subunit [Herbinix sp.]